MSNTGIQVYNNNGILQIDTMFKNIQFIDKITTVVNDRALSGGYYGSIHDVYHQNDRYYRSIEMSNAVVNSVVALRCTNGKFITWEETHNQIGPYPPWNPGPPNLTIYGEVNATVTVYRFSWDSISPGQYLEIFNTDGTRVFSDTGDFMRILDFKTGYHYPGHTLTNGYVVASTTHASNIVTAVAQCYPCKLSLQSYETRLSYHFNSTSTTANFDEYVRVPPQYEDQIAWDYETFYPYYGYLVLDVTGL